METKEKTIVDKIIAKLESGDRTVYVDNLLDILQKESPEKYRLIIKAIDELKNQCIESSLYKEIGDYIPEQYILEINNIPQKDYLHSHMYGVTRYATKWIFPKGDIWIDKINMIKTKNNLRHNQVFMDDWSEPGFVKIWILRG